MRKQPQMSKQTSRYDFPSLSPLHERADYSRKILKINDAIKSIISISHMERMDIIAINNRSLCNHSKIRRAERTNRKITLTNRLNLPNLKQLRLDLRKSSSSKNQHKDKPPTAKGHHVPSEVTNADAQLCEKFIEEYISKLKEEKRFDVLANKTKLIEEACREIMMKLEITKSKDKSEKGEKEKSHNKRSKGENGLNGANGANGANDEAETKHLKIPNYRKARSITETEYSQQINRIRRSSEYEMKARALNERLFLRKIKQIKIHSQPD